MALLFMDSFDHYATTDIAEKWSSTSVSGGGAVAIGTTNGRRGGPGFRATHPISGTALLNKTLSPVDPTTVIAGFSLLTSVAPSSTHGSAIFRVQDSPTAQWSLVLLSDLRLQIKQGGVAGTVLATSGPTGIVVGAVAYIEVKVVIHPSAGTADVQVNGVSVLSATGLNTRNTSNNVWNIAQLGVSNGATNSGTTDFDDLYILDGSGPAPWNTFLGDVRVDVRNPTAAGTTTGWTPSTGSNWQNVDDAAPNDDTDYNSAATTALTDIFVVQDAPVAGAAIYGVQVNLSAKKTDVGTCSLASVVRQGTTNLSATAQNPGTSYAYLQTVYQTNPHTSAQWTEADFNAAEYGYTRVS